MNKEILVRYSELTLKGKNKKEFINFLVSSLQKKLSLKNLNYKLNKTNDRLIIIPDEDPKKYFDSLSKTVGISWYAEMFRFEASKKILADSLREMITNIKAKTFRISAKAIDRTLFESSKELTSFVAAQILNSTEMTVDLENYDVEINVKILENKEILLYIKKYRGIIGLPSGTAGKVLTLLSGGIDSPVAAYKLITRGAQSSFLTFLTDRTGNKEMLFKIKELATKVNEFNHTNGNLYLVNFSRVQAEITKLKDTSYRITLLRRMYLKFAELLANKYGYEAFVTGDSLGQVASQTMHSMTVVSSITNKLVLRPLVAMAKEEIISIATDINTLELSNLPGEDMCLLFAPEKPIIHPKLDKVNELEEQLEDMESKLLQVFEEDLRVIKLGK